MFDKLNYIELSGNKYPLKCDMVVLEQIQEEFGDLGTFENKLIGFVPAKEEDGSLKRNDAGMLVGRYEQPNLKMVNQTLFWMISEGLAIEAEECGEEKRRVEREHLLREIDIPPSEIGQKLHEEFLRCFVRKNSETTQGEKNQKTEKSPNK
ncbi:hypothetical protein LQE92_11895 [Lacrimispora sp. NSJ-141]|uniref:Uncharacterized protein n=1 Tax=Lientehia hominis TaxID=2897778 RepID=A0AAP2W9I7_9FIRM|nr:hypothetical protein [Lientehia hominis]MCD2493316.1 hypothetical protein [Lientehia hominis]